MEETNNMEIRTLSRMDTSILDAIKVSGGRQLTASEIEAKIYLANTRTVLWLKRLRQDIDDKRPCVDLYRYGKKKNRLNHLDMFVYWHEAQQF